MKSTSHHHHSREGTPLQIEVNLDDAWLNRFLASQQMHIPVTEKYHLSNILFTIAGHQVIVTADIVEKKGTAIRLTCQPGFDISNQQFSLKELEIQVFSRNILLKGAGWFARTFMGARLDKKAQDALNTLYQKQVSKVITDGLHIKVPDGGLASVKVHTLNIDRMTFREKSISVLVSVLGIWTVHLK